MAFAFALVLASPARAAAPPVNAYAPQPGVEKASIVGFSGSPYVQRAGGAGREDVRGLPVKLSAGDSVHTGSGGRVLILSRSGSLSPVDHYALLMLVV